MQIDLKQFLWRSRSVWITTPLIALLVIGARLAGVLQAWEWAAYDRYMHLRPGEGGDDRVVIVGITEKDIQEVGRAIMPDGIYAALIEKLKSRNPRVIGLDIYRDQPVEPGHNELVKVFQTTPNLIGIEKVIGNSDLQRVAPPPALKQKDPPQVGANDILIDTDKIIRRSFISLPDPENEQASIPSFPMYAAALYLERDGIELGETGPNEWKQWTLGNTLLRRFDSNDGGYVRADSRGYQILINYRGPVRTFNTVSLMDVLKDRIPADWGRDRIILIGMVGDSSNDLFYIPYSNNLISTPDPVPGVEIHANLASQILSSVLDSRPLFRSWPEPLEYLWIFAWSGIGAFIAWRTMRYTGEARTLLLKASSIVIVAAASLVGSTYLAFLQGWWIPVVPPMLAFVGSASAITALIARSAGDIRKTFGRYLTDAVVANLLEHPEGLKMGGERRKITILTSDLRGFTALSERLSPEEVVKILNFYLSHMADTIAQYQGTIDEFMGDGILVLFGAPTARHDDPERAVACAIAMQQAMSQVNSQMQAWGLPNLDMGIGINTGEVVVGNIGSEKRTKYGIVGSQVNLTYRIESYTTGGQILISETTLKEVNADIKTNGSKEVSPKGVAQPIRIYDVGGIGAPYSLTLTKEEEIYYPLAEPISLQYAVIEGKDIGNTTYWGHLIQLSAKGGQVRLEKRENSNLPPALGNIKLNFSGLDSVEALQDEDVYAKVLEEPASQGCFYIQFTAKSPKVDAKLKEIYTATKAS
ncbi:adenylate/guanylate cyclase domain-containing protein [Oscillatoria sp. FACHB-1406]|uniref:CHASE2 domain-containing protein n=1 Tax=Oscillatoria sp. FACHB-1406 TaxID=2692846 RepID=UPI001687312D|nr:adenylate/guanylate cyclase domain-containing protein [Oscillatoria sp. FACHB-1406]MBD2576864.1 adenylate/guanylate cyclase domain-containing protein [Oscillatoria sp. FACHB-1406]